VAEFAVARPAHLTAEHVGHELHAVADAEHRRAELEDAGRAPGSPFLGNALRPARKNDPGRILRAQRLYWRIERHDLGVHRQLAQTTSDELGVLRAEIQNENGLMGHAEPDY
jgi:hypothetical protein